jgi:hypothetical protein
VPQVPQAGTSLYTLGTRYTASFDRAVEYTAEAQSEYGFPGGTENSPGSNTFYFNYDYGVDSWLFNPDSMTTGISQEDLSAAQDAQAVLYAKALIAQYVLILEGYQISGTNIVVSATASLFSLSREDTDYSIVNISLP